MLGLLVCEATDVENSASVRRERVGKAHLDLFNELQAEDRRVAEVFAAAHASLAARDLADQIAADDRLRAALAACAPTDTDHNREAVDGLCVEENDDAR
ncbi:MULTISPECIES: hypothetical protein [unclassified Stenotrophomonas]|uniref:hypothetical protein n=1 Tax=unclassified Stenotrophomonas TaxID=196198 RepID=UPI002448C04F|nr:MULTISPECIES: hypothetical protein [unclassified Stenotrophomonas]MDH0277294.1 hypothetical protein [Stenotrophomonas sp. GD04089]MDH1911568.1 hypothetical protein [Stenotrophomonas sp. GD03794]